MALFLLVAYILILALQVVLLVMSMRKKTKKLWTSLFLVEVISMIIAFGLMIYYNHLSGYGFMPGLSYLGEVLFSFGAMVLYGICILVSVFLYLMTGHEPMKKREEVK